MHCYWWLDPAHLACELVSNLICNSYWDISALVSCVFCVVEIFSQHPYIEQGRMKGHSSLQLHFVIQDDETAVILTETSCLLSLLTMLLVKLVWICCHVISFLYYHYSRLWGKGVEFIPTIMPMSCWQRMLTQLLKLWSDRMKWGIPASLSALSRGSISVKSGDTQC